jgi:hypothetical protein
MCRIKPCLFFHHLRSHNDTYMLDDYLKQVCVYRLHHSNGHYHVNLHRNDRLLTPTVPSPVIKYHEGCTESGVTLCHALLQDQNVNMAPSWISGTSSACAIAACNHRPTDCIARQSTTIWLPVSKPFQYRYCGKCLRGPYVSDRRTSPEDA